MVLSTTVSQQCWTDVHLYAESHGTNQQARVNRLNWDGKGSPEGLFPSRDSEARHAPAPDGGGAPPGSAARVEPKP